MATNGSFNTSGYQNRYLTFSWVEKSQSIEKNTTTISWTLKGGGSASGFYYTQNVKVKIAGEVVFQHTKAQNGQIKLYNGTTVASGTFTFTHDADGSKDFQVDVEAGIYVWEPNCSGTKKFTLDTIPRASTLTASNGTLGTAQTLTINRAVSTFKHRLTFKCGNQAGYIAGMTTEYTTETEFSWTPPISLAAQNKTGTSVEVNLNLYTYASDGTHIGTTTKVITCTIPSTVKPSVTIAWEDTTGAATTYGQPVQSLSKLKITLDATESHDSEIKSYAITANGVKYTTNPATTDALKEAGATKISATVKDGRGRSGSNSVTLDVLAYTAPIVSLLTVHRCDQDGTENEQGNYVKVTFSATVTNLNGKNKPTYKLRYKSADASGYTEVTLNGLASTYTVTKYDYIFAADGNSSHDVEIIVSDNHGTAGRATSASTAFTLMNWHESGTGMAIGKVSEKQNTLEVGIDSDLQGEVYGKVYGLGTLPAVSENADLNDYLTPGVYAVRTTDIAGTVKNMPAQAKRAGRLIVSNANGATMTGVGKWAYIEQRFIPNAYGAIAEDTGAWVRHISQGGTSTFTYHDWINEALKAYPIGSIHLRYDTKNPADLFGGTWTQITARVLRAGSAGSIGAEGDIASGSGRTYIDVAVWRRTA